MTGVGGIVDLTGQSVPKGAVKANVDPREPARRTIAYDTVHLQRAKDLVGLVLTPIIGLVGSVVGFYFGAQTAQQAQQSQPGPTG
jgi:hypothetical protein